ncbi:NDR1/HIN1-like protein 12 [Lycium barbarum]|uniref:NDR1/HIN1-like protein 12 n=1 Tax=Lycium barbarum TaxID=112863 RepID=UPI00293E83E1|nr:NDR1/HIN1-like protein 12 [Lycium barbarum]
MPKPVLGPERRTNPLIWGVAILCTLITLSVIITGLVVFIGYMVVRPKVPQMYVRSANVDNFAYDMSNLMSIKLSIVINAQNDNAKAHASFYETYYTLWFDGVKVAYLRSDPFDVARNSSIPLYYPVESTSIALTPEEGEIAELALSQRQVALDLKGSTRTRWRVGIVGSVKFWLHLNCKLKLPLNGSTVYPKCSTKS